MTRVYCGIGPSQASSSSVASVSASMLINLSGASSVPATRRLLTISANATFVQSFITQLAQNINIPSSTVRVDSADFVNGDPNVILVGFTLLADTSASAGVSPAQALQTLAQKLAEGTLTGSVVAKADTSRALSASYTCADGRAVSSASDCTQTSAASGVAMTSAWAVAAAGLLALLAIGA